MPDNYPDPQIGMRVIVPLATKKMIGIVVRKLTSLPRNLSADKVKDLIFIPDSQPIVSRSQLSLWQWIADYYMCPIGDVMVAALPAKVTDKSYELNKAKRRVKLPVFDGTIEPIHALSATQQKAFVSIREQWNDKEVVLLHGVTSSGKTEVYMHLIEEQLQQGKQVLYLVPEIALTTQLTDRLQRVFGDRLWVYHSRVSDAQRMEMYRQLITDPDTPRVVVGARSAVFLPIQRLGLIIVDEEHDPSYKQQEPAPRYHARAIAIMVAHHQQAKVLLGTATPSVETYYNTQSGKFGLVEMKERYAGLQLPDIHLIDLNRQYHRKEMYGHLSDPLVDKMKTELDRGKQIILFQNRRGYAPLMMCENCRHIPSCPDCDVPLTLHLQERELRCHYCGHSEPLPSICPNCGARYKIIGFGTERIEDEISQLFPQARVARMDLDTTRKKDDYQDIIGRFARHEVDILIGTQMVTKGLHFDDVSLVAVLSADHLFQQADYTVFERAYQMLEQVAGRAGRKGEQGQVIIQTWDPQHPIFDYIRAHNYQALYQEQITERQMFHFPPFHRLIMLTVRHTSPALTIAAAQALQQRLQAVFGERVSGVIIPAVTRVQRYTLRQIRLRIEQNANIQKAKDLLTKQIAEVLATPSYKAVQILTNVDPL